MHTVADMKRPFRFSTAGLVAVGCLCLAFASCHSAHDPTCRTEGELPARHEPPLERLTPPVADQPFQQVCYETVHAEIPKPAGAEYVNDTEVCETCHETYVKTFHDNVHRGQTTAKPATGRPAATWKPAARSRG